MISIGKLFNIPNLLTAGNMLSGVMSIFFVFMGKFEWAPWCIFLGALFDFFDGFVARILKQQSELGKQLDSLADMITFGLAPGVFMMVVLAVAIEMGAHPNGENVSGYVANVLENWKLGLFYDSSVPFSGFNKYVPFLGLLIPLFSLFRLAKFNIDVRQSDSFIGMPTPAVTLFFSTFPLALWWYFSTDGYPVVFVNYLFHPLFVGSLIVLMSISLVSEIPLFALKFKNFDWKGNEHRYSFLFISLLLIVFTSVWAIAIIVFLYLVLSIFVNVMNSQNKK